MSSKTKSISGDNRFKKNAFFQEMNLQALSEERDSLSDDCDSGNDEPSDYFPLERGASNSNTPQVGQHLYLLTCTRVG
jgi:hypothetical protein